jgi:phosphate transport system permease protein
MALPYHLYVIATGTDIEKSRAMAYGTALILIIVYYF